MKKTFTLIVCLFLIGIVSVFNSCSKDKVKGCMDTDSKNYSSSAEEDDGSCMYEGSVIFWFNEAASDSLSTYDAITLYYYIDGVEVGSSNVYTYYDVAPDCDQAGTVTVTKDLGTLKSKSFTYSIKDQDGNEWLSDIVTFKANFCTKIQLETN